MAGYEHAVPQWKKDEVTQLATLIKKSKMVGLVIVGGIGAKQLQTIRDSLRGSAVLKMTRNTLMIRAIKESKAKGVEALADHVKGAVAIIFSDKDPFTLSKFLSENKSRAPAKAGQVATNDIKIPEMNTGVAPGPFISELAALKIPARVKTGVIHITEDTIVVKRGETVSGAMALVLSRLGIEPMELRLRLAAAYTEGSVITSEAFEVDLEGILKELILAHQYAMNLSVNIEYPTAETIRIMLGKANLEAKNLAMKTGYFVPDLLPQFLVKANSEALALASVLSSKNPDAVPPDALKKANK
jgi:large subunit ribosomal protein L10